MNTDLGVIDDSEERACIADTWTGPIPNTCHSHTRRYSCDPHSTDYETKARSIGKT